MFIIITKLWSYITIPRFVELNKTKYWRYRGDKKYNIISSENRKNPTWTDGVVKEHKNLRAEKLEEEVLALIKEKYGEVKPE